MAAKKAHFIDVRQIGPNRERDISGVCATCGTVLLTRLEDKAQGPIAEHLHAKLAALFDLHVQKEH